MESLTHWVAKRIGGRMSKRLVARLPVLASAGTVALVALFLACQQQLVPTDSNDPEGPVATILTLNVGDTLVLGLGAVVQLEATPRDATGQPVPDYVITWSSSDSSVVYVDELGSLSAIDIGGAAVTATAEKRGSRGQGKENAPGQLKKKTEVIVDPEPVASVEVVPDQLTMPVGAAVRLTAILRDSNGNELQGRDVAWSSSDAAIATVDQGGNVSGAAPGAATITASSEGKSGSSAVTVVLAQEPVATVEVVPDQATIPVGGAIGLTAILRDAAGSELRDRAVTWSSNDDAIATVDQGGNVFGQGPGLAAITASSEGRSGNAAVTVEAPSPVVDMAVWPPGVDVESGQRVQFYAAALQADRTVTCIPESPSQDPNVLFNANVVAGCDSATALLDFSKANGTSASQPSRWAGGASRLTLPVGIGAN